MTNSFKFGRIFGVEVGVHWSWTFIFVVVTWSFARGVLDHFYPEWGPVRLWIGGGLIAAVFFLSVLAHEMSHAIVSNKLGLPVRSITLFIFGGVANLSREPDSAGDEFKIAVVGPVTSLLLGVLFAAGWAAAYAFDDGIAGICAQLALINVFLAVFNMLPGFPLDGGRVFRAIAWSRNHDRLRATRWATRAGEWIAYGMMAIGVIEIVLTGDLNGLWFVFIGLFLRQAAVSSYEQMVIETTLSGIVVRDVMRSDFQTVPPDVSVEELVREGIMRSHRRCFVIIAAGEFVGLVTLTDVRKIPENEWASTTVYRAMTPSAQLHTVQPGDSLMAFLSLMTEHDVSQLPVIEQREIVGMLDRSDVMRLIQVRRDLGTKKAPSPQSAPAPEEAPGR